MVEQVEKLQAQIPSGAIRWVRPGGIHLTLKFLGNVSHERVDQVKETLHEVVARYRVFTIAVGEFGCFPNTTRPRVLWVGIEEPSGTLTGLQASLEGSFTKLGFEAENRAFHPHLTLGRVKRGTIRSDMRSLSETLGNVRIGHLGSLEVDTIHLMRSELKPSGAIYTKLASAKLKSL